MSFDGFHTLLNVPANAAHASAEYEQELPLGLASRNPGTNALMSALAESL